MVRKDNSKRMHHPLVSSDMIFLKLNEEWQISILPVTLAEFGEFIRNGKYFNQDHWNGFCSTDNGDAVLRRIGYGLRSSKEAVGNINWFEADAYCRCMGGRLPWLAEQDSLRANLMTSSRKGIRQTPRGKILSREWCGEWYNRNSGRSNVRASETPPTRVIVGEPHHAVPDYTAPNLGFRLVRPV